MLRTALLLLLLLPALAFAQLKISGKIVSATDKKPVANASVFLNNASVGNKTTEDGSFTLNNVRPGQYDLIVSILGYENHSQTVLVNNNDIALPPISLAPKTFELAEVKIKPNADWERYYAQFKIQFLGTSANAAQCKILNPDILNLDYNKKTYTLEASSYDFLEIENQALGYKIKYKLNTFSYNSYTGYMYYDGVSVFEDLKGSNGKVRKWKKRRLIAYLGSPMHFLRSVITNQLKQEDFRAFRLIRKPNPAFQGGVYDTKNKYIQMLVKQPLDINDFAKRTDQPGLFALDFKDCLYVVYNKKSADNSLDVYRPLDVPSSYATSILTFDEHETYIFFDNNGIMNNPRNAIFEGDWTTYRFAEMLPVDYEPEPAK